MIPPDASLSARTLGGGRVDSIGQDAWRLSIPEGRGGQYRLAQLDDYTRLPRGEFPWTRPLQLRLRARSSEANLPGTWGFGLWNDPFAAELGFAGGARRLPMLPNAAWFFFASPENYLTLHDDIPAWGELAATFQSRQIPSVALALGLPLLPLFYLSSGARWLRRGGRRLIRQDAARLPSTPQNPGESVTIWREYTLSWQPGEAIFEVDGETALRTSIVPPGPLGLVIWIDNQFAAIPPAGRLAFGTLPNPGPAWVEIAGLDLTPG